MTGKTTEDTENTSVHNAAASTLSIGHAVANQALEGAEQAQKLVDNTNETFSEGSAAVANALTFKSYTDGNTPLRATKNKDGKWEAQKEVANVNLRQGTFSKKIKKNDVKITNEVITAKDLGENAHRYGNGEWKSDKGGSTNSENIKKRYKLGGEKTDDGHLDASLDQIDISDGRSLLSRTVKFKSLLGFDDSTFLTFIKKVDVFNNASDISTKQEAYINVIYQGYAWLAAFPNLNDKKANKKRAIINEIISGSISNFAEVELTYLAFEDAYKSFTADSSIDILNSSDFSGIDAFKKLKAFLKEKKIWEDQHNSPVKNKNHSKEKEAMKNIEKLGTLEVKASGEFNIIPGVLKISNPTLKLEDLGKKITITSGISLAAGVNIEAAQLNASGEFTIEINNENIWNSPNSDFKIATTLENGEVNGKFMNQKFKIEGVKYSTTSPEKISADTAVWNGEILSKVVSITFDNPSISNDKGFYFTSATGSLSEISLGNSAKAKNLLIRIEKKGVEYIVKGSGEVNSMLDLDGLTNANIIATVNIVRNPNKEYYYLIKDGNINAQLWSSNIAISEVNTSGYTNEGIVNLINFSATVVDLENSIKPFKFGVFTIQARTIALFNEKSKKGFQLTLDATMGNVFPSPFGDENSLKGHAKIETGITSDPEKKKANFKFVTLHFEGSIKNPLSSISILDDWEGNRMDIGASIMVFPGVFAEFGLFIESLLSFGGNIEITATKNDNNGVLLHIDAPVAEGKVAAGAYAGVQAGSALLASFALYLEAFGEIDAKLHGEFEKIFSLDNNTPSKKASIDFTLEGDANVIAQLRAVARALLFFKKVWKYELASKNLGHFSYSTNEDKNTGFSANTEKLVDNEPGFNDKALKEGENINGRKRTEIKEMSIKELINLSTEDRWSKNEKKDIVDSFALQENEIVEGSKIGYETRFDNDTEDSLNKYRNNRISLAEVTNSENSEIIEATVSLNFLQILNARLNNLNVYSEFINNRIDPKQEITPNPDLSEQKKRKEYHTLVNEKLNITQPFVNHYSKLVTDLISEISNENTDLANGIYTIPFQNNTEEIQTIENFKKEIFRKTFILQSGISNESEMKKFSKALFSFRISKKIFQITMKNNNLLLGKKIGEKDTELRSKLANHRIDTNITLTN